MQTVCDMTESLLKLSYKLKSHPHTFSSHDANFVSFLLHILLHDSRDGGFIIYQSITKWKCYVNTISTYIFVGLVDPNFFFLMKNGSRAFIRFVNAYDL